MYIQVSPGLERIGCIFCRVDPVCKVKFINTSAHIIPYTGKLWYYHVFVKFHVKVLLWSEVTHKKPVVIINKFAGVLYFLRFPATSIFI